jgi:hypothetical protein
MRLLVSLAAVCAVLGAPASALAAPCPDDPERPADTWYVQDDTTHGDEWTGDQIARPLPLLHAYRVSLNPGVSRSSTDVNDLMLTPPDGVPLTRDGHTVIVAPKSAGPLVITATWTEHSGFDPDCSRSASITLDIRALTERPVVRVKKFIATDRPLVILTVTVTRSPFGVAEPVTLRAKVGRKASAPSGTPKSLFSLPFGMPAFGTKAPSSGLLARRSAKLSGVKVSALSAFDPENVEQIPVPSGGTTAQATFFFDGTGRKVRNRFGSFYRTGVLARRGLLVDVVQGGTVLGTMRTGILCVNPRSGGPRCRLPGYRTSG